MIFFFRSSPSKQIGALFVKGLEVGQQSLVLGMGRACKVLLGITLAQNSAR